jgi:hypothetical protein
MVGLVGLLIATPRGVSADDNKEVRDAVEKLADLLEKKDYDAAKKEAAAIAKKYDELEHVMILLGPRDMGGFGVGPKAGDIKPDDMEQKLSDLATKKALTDAEWKAQGAAIKRMALRAAAVGELAQHYAPKAKAGLWKGFSTDMQKAALELAEATKPDQVKTVAGKMNSSCSGCHTEFK